MHGSILLSLCNSKPIDVKLCTRKLNLRLIFDSILHFTHPVQLTTNTMAINQPVAKYKKTAHWGKNLK